MKTRYPVLLFCFLLIFGSLAGWAQDQRTLSTRVADVLAQFPADNSIHRDRLGKEIVDLGPEGIADITRRLLPAGTGNDTSIRFAVNAMAAAASQFGEETRRAAAEKGLISALASASDVEVKTFLLTQLRLVGREEAVAAVKPLLLHADLFEPATQLMLSIGNTTAKQALLSALGQSKDANQITLVKALGQLKVAEANQSIIALAGSGNLNLRRTALAALAGIASADSYLTLSGAARKVAFRYDTANATAALLTYARNLGEKGDLALCERICRLVMRNAIDKDRLPSNSEALGILAEYKGYDALADLLLAVDNPDKAYRTAALNFAEKITGPAAQRRWIAKAKTAAPETRAEIIDMLGRQKDPRTLPFLLSSLQAPEAPVVLAAAEALAKIKKAEAIGDLLPLLKTRPAEETKGITNVLMWIVDERHLDPLVAQMDGLSPAAKAGTIDIIGAKAGKRYYEKVLASTNDSNADVKMASFRALKHLVGAKDIPVLLRMLESSADPEQVKEIQNALVQAANQIEPAQLRAKPILEAMKSSGKQDQIVEILPQIGGKDALQMVAERFEKTEGNSKETAFRVLTQWKDPEAAQKLYAICAAGDGKYRKEAFSGFLRQISMSDLPGDQKVLQLRKLLPFTTDAAGKRSILRALERVKSFQSFLIVSRFMDDAEIANDAAWSTMRIALPSSAGKDGLSGALVREALNKVLQTLSGFESDYNKENIRAYLNVMPKNEGFVPLFNGKDLTGWKGLVEDPLARAKMTPEELAGKQAEANQKMGNNWSVRDGMIVFNGKGQNICTVKDYADFEMIVDWRITKSGDSGIYLRGTPQVQIWDPARTDVGAQVGSGGLYNNQKNPSKPLVFADNPVGEWNTFRITMIGEKVTVYLNGVKVVDNTTMENYWDRKQSIFPSGAIELQAHGTDLAFRDIYVKELSEKEFNLTDEEKAEGFVSLFNGRDLSGWVGNKVDYQVENGTITLHPQPGSRGNLYSEKQYSDFQLRFEFLLTPGANNGIGIRAPLEGDAAYAGMEVQVLDDTAPIYAELQEYQYHGSVYGILPAKRGHLKPLGEWNVEEITARGSHIQVKLNGVLIVDGDLREASKNGTLDHRDHPGIQRTSGHIGFLGHGSVVSFRNLRIKDLSQ